MEKRDLISYNIKKKKNEKSKDFCKADSNVYLFTYLLF